MSQLAATSSERRKEHRSPRAFALWLRPGGSQAYISAWMLDVSSSAAAVLVPTDLAPAVGQVVDLLEMPSASRIVREEVGGLPARARVLRHDASEGLTRRVALRFDAEHPCALLPSAPRSILTGARPRCGAPPVFVPTDKPQRKPQAVGR